MKNILEFWKWSVFDHFSWDHAATLMSAAIAALIAVGVAVITYPRHATDRSEGA